MTLSDELISQLVKVTNNNAKRGVEKGDNVVYGKVVNDGERQFVQLDGSDCLTPAVPLVEINEDERVVVSITNHTAIITGNATNPSVGVKTADGLRSEISQTAGEIRLLVEDTKNNLQSSITVNADQIASLSSRMGVAESSIVQNADSITSIVKTQNGLTEFKQTVEGFSFMGGDVKITGGDLVLTGAITWSDLSGDMQTKITNATPISQFSVNGTSGWHAVMTGSDKYRRDSTDGGATWGPAYQFRGTDGMNGVNGSDAEVPPYITETAITKIDIMSPTIYAGDFYAYKGSNTFVNINDNGFYLYHANATNPKAMLATDYDDTIVKLVLGAGSSNMSDTMSRLFVEKTRSEAGIYFYDDYNNKCGFRFGSNGVISVVGSMPATFG